jgi:ATP synthase protein I
MSEDGKSKSGHWQSDLRSSSSFLTIGVQLAGSMLVYIFIGYFLDRWLDTEPWFLIAGALVGMVAFFVQLFKLVKRLEADSKRAKEEKEAGSKRAPN